MEQLVTCCAQSRSANRRFTGLFLLLMPFLGLACLRLRERKASESAYSSNCCSACSSWSGYWTRGAPAPTNSAYLGGPTGTEE
ncbi:hypothetical protein, conserved [Eimeria necatrix]|uniref:Uncharacterized protein n=1 Tax=Eimeria necatrix TaxID=51315 RepID=U6N4D1_9EIME|nr:hypothetical protein, conserved [Eimeria necatrix]CDJ70144.1 hypothetical protein, conserved [Eimeria necatrix]